MIRSCRTKSWSSFSFWVPDSPQTELSGHCGLGMILRVLVTLLRFQTVKRNHNFPVRSWYRPFFEIATIRGVRNIPPKPYILIFYITKTHRKNSSKTEPFCSKAVNSNTRRNSLNCNPKDNLTSATLYELTCTIAFVSTNDSNVEMLIFVMGYSTVILSVVSKDPTKLLASRCKSYCATWENGTLHCWKREILSCDWSLVVVRSDSFLNPNLDRGGGSNPRLFKMGHFTCHRRTAWQSKVLIKRLNLF